MAELKFNFYSVEKIGYFSKETGDLEFGSLSGTLNQLKSWTSLGNKPLSDTTTYEPNDVLRAYCFDIQKDTSNGDFLLTMWNEIENEDGEVSAANLNEPVGQAHVQSGNFGAGFMPGYAAYFWFIPSMNIFATIRRKNISNGHRQLKAYMKGFLSRFSDYVIQEDNRDGSGFEVLGYAENQDDDPQDLRPVFETSRHKKSRIIDEIRLNRERIRKIVRQSEMALPTNGESSFMSKVLEDLHISTPSPIAEDLKIKYEFPFQPSENELDQIITGWEAEEGNDWSRIGFVYSGESQTQWLDFVFSKEKLDLSVEIDDNGIMNARSLLRSITNNREYFLASLSNE